MILIMEDVTAFVADGIATGSTLYCIYFVLFLSLFILFYVKL